MIFLDTSFLYAVFIHDDPHYEKAMDFLNELNHEKMTIIPLEVIQELLTVITYKVSNEAADQVAEFLLNDESPALVFFSDEEIVQETVRGMRSLSPHQLSYVDALLVHLSKRFDSKVLTFDQELNAFLDSA